MKALARFVRRGVRSRRVAALEREVARLSRDLVSVRAELEAAAARLKVAAVEVELLAAVVARDRERVRAETARHARQAAGSEAGGYAANGFARGT